MWFLTSKLNSIRSQRIVSTISSLSEKWLTSLENRRKLFYLLERISSAHKLTHSSVGFLNIAYEEIKGRANWMRWDKMNSNTEHDSGRIEFALVTLVVLCVTNFLKLRRLIWNLLQFLVVCLCWRCQWSIKISKYSISRVSLAKSRPKHTKSCNQSQ